MNESNEYVLPIDVSMVCHQTGFEQLGDKDLDECFLYFGSFLSMIQNKKVSQTNYLLFLIEKPELRETLMQMTGIETFQQLIKEMAIRYPLSYKSKIVNRGIKKWKKLAKR